VEGESKSPKTLVNFHCRALTISFLEQRIRHVEIAPGYREKLHVTFASQHAKSNPALITLKFMFAAPLICFDDRFASMSRDTKKYDFSNVNNNAKKIKSRTDLFIL